jgi:hypothetical protein
MNTFKSCSEAVIHTHQLKIKYHNNSTGNDIADTPANQSSMRRTGTPKPLNTPWNPRSRSMTRHVPTRIPHTHGEPERYQSSNRKSGARKFNLKHTRAPLVDTAERGVVLVRADAEKVGFSYGRTTANTSHSCTPNRLTTTTNKNLWGMCT